MAKRAPKRIALDHDDFAARHVGKTEDGRQFFLTRPFVPAHERDPGQEFLALYLFEPAGTLVEARIEALGPRAMLDEARSRAAEDAALASLGPVKFGRIKVAPFKVERFGIEFGFIANPPEESGDDWSVVVEPGDFMCFWPPWTSGDYDT